MKKYYYKDFFFDAILYDYKNFVYMVPKSQSFYVRLVDMLESLVADNPNKRKTYSSIILSNSEIKKSRGYCPSPYLAKKHYKYVEFVYDENLSYTTDQGYIDTLDIEIIGDTVLFRFDTGILEFLKKELKDYDMDNSYGESTFTHAGFMYCPSCWF